MAKADSFGARRLLDLGSGTAETWSVHAVPGAEDLPFSLKIVLENLLRHEDGVTVTAEAIACLAQGAGTGDEVSFSPARVFLHDTNGIPVLTDLAAMREVVRDLGGDPHAVDPVIPAELTVDHSVVTDVAGRPDAMTRNVAREYERNEERYRFLKWGQQQFRRLAVVPPGTGIMHQINLEYLADVVVRRDGRAFPDTLVGTDSHTTMVNGLGVLAWGVGGIEAEAAMLGLPVSTLVPPVVGLELIGERQPGVTATDLVLTIAEMLRARGVVGCFVEFTGPSVGAVPLADRATLANMSPEFGSTCAIFPIDRVTVDYLRFTGREADHVQAVERYAKEQGLWHDPAARPRFDQLVRLDLSTVEPSLAGPRRPQDRVPLASARGRFQSALAELLADRAPGDAVDEAGRESFPASDASALTAVAPPPRDGGGLRHGAVAIAAITSCTNTSNPAVMVAAGLLARNAVRAGLATKPWVRTSLAPGSKVVTDYLARSGLDRPLEQLGFHTVGYGCMTCIGNSGPLAPEVVREVADRDLVVAAVLSGNRNFDGRINNDVAMNYLASPPLVVAYALAGSMDVDLLHDSLGADASGEPVYLADLWPSDAEVEDVVRAHLDPAMFAARYADVFTGEERWADLSVGGSATFDWDPESTYVRRPPFLDGLSPTPGEVADIAGARVLAVLGDSVTTDHICPAGRIPADSPAGEFLRARGETDLSTYASRRGNHEVMLRGAFGNQRLRNRLVPHRRGGWTLDHLDGRERTVFDAAEHYRAAGTPLLVLAGTEYGTGSSRDWAAKGTALLGVRAVLAESFERIHRANLIGMGVLPLQFLDGDGVATLGLTGRETFAVEGLAGLGEDGWPREVTVRAESGRGTRTFRVRVRLDSATEAKYLRHGGILPFVARSLTAAASPVPA
ncbi:aconitate hydratase AcnA [Geodermatophilus sp. DF01-2]|uniref:aconitate hydratase AcnA n=1 Tax=Geodermatophilus sp. DF01-2 TaxID=2559610 RepID=UPI001073E259|nr:aconitate hydratase AcnA [Geodermatophilus sp. DF01_2]TFV64767.1 aconitate hydratase AcnA [Geodermatophilus sp. DF01_2]